MTSSQPSRPLSFLFVVPRFHTNLAFAVRGLVAAGHQVTVVCPDIADNEDHSVITPIRLGPAPSWGALAALLRRTRPDIILLRRVPVLSSRIFYLSKLFGLRAIAYTQTPANEAVPMSRRLHSLLRGRPWRRVTPVRGTSDQPRDPSAVYIPFPVAPADVGERAYAPGGRVRILCVGKLSQTRKRHLDLVEALAPLVDRFAFSLTIAGSSEQQVNNASAAYLDRVLRLGDGATLDGRITVRADVPFAEMAALYRTHDLCVLPSEKEQLGSAPLEATAHGCVPIVAADSGCAGSITAEAGALFPTGDIDALRAVLVRFLGDHAALAHAGAAARQLAVDELSMARYAARMETLARRR